MTNADQILAAIQNGFRTVGEIMEATNLHRMEVHKALEILEGKGLVEVAPVTDRTATEAETQS